MDRLPLTPFQIIDAVNQAEGRPSGPAPTGYVDENGDPVVPNWPGFSGALATIPTEQRVVRRDEAPPKADANVTGGDAATGPETARSAEGGARAMRSVTIELPAVVLEEHVRLDTGSGVWRDNAFDLSERELATVRRVVVGAIKRQLREQERKLVSEVGGLRRAMRARGSKREGA